MLSDMSMSKEEIVTNPQTSDDITIYVVLIMFSKIGLGMIVFNRKIN